tara:strand:+ start:850 stop:1263 length:414 start_codon:yes stop_codon:yes gene_type:complete
MEVKTTDWMVMGMIHAYKIIQKASKENEGCSLNDVDYSYLTELQRRDIEKPSLLSDEFPYFFEESNTSAHDNVHLGMMNVFTMLGKHKENGEDLDKMNVPFLVESLTEELENGDLVKSYDDIFVSIEKMADGIQEFR